MRKAAKEKKIMFFSKIKFAVCFLARSYFSCLASLPNFCEHYCSLRRSFCVKYRDALCFSPCNPSISEACSLLLYYFTNPLRILFVIVMRHFQLSLNWFVFPVSAKIKPRQLFRLHVLY